MSEEKLGGIAICQLASQSFIPGYVLGHNCWICGEALQVSGVADVGIKNFGLHPMCNDCGLQITKRLEDRGVPLAKVNTSEIRDAAIELEDRMGSA